MSDQLTKEQIQTQYSQNVTMLGDKLFRFLLPVLEISNLLTRLLYLNSEMHKRVQEEALTKPAGSAE